jgi:hypothetical protein
MQTTRQYNGIREKLAQKRQDDHDTGVRMARPEHVLPKRIVAWITAFQHAQ